MVGKIPPNHPLKNRVFPYKVYPFWGFSPYFWKHPSDIIPLKEKTGELQRGNVKYKSGHNSPIFINLQLVLDVLILQKGPCERSWPTYQHRRCGNAKVWDVKMKHRRWSLHPTLLKESLPFTCMKIYIDKSKAAH